ncbi:helix-turn-helix domain-containing protein [Eubacterium multiforme]|uniref:Transcriptional regulator n=1 Tax=Eubacterium multiforme TaxID=83339 RepID=A0ABT9USG4_9FIRM|nr:helix-turn-helix domain-containing protein [Eubacterium multiforme]MDQ0149246.1 putative transcriptional regulator [Eubacterium multiforme]
MEGYIKGYTVIQNKLITAPISNGAYRLGSYISSICYGDKLECFPSQKTLAEALNRSVRTIQRYLKELYENNIISKRRRGHLTNVYTVLVKKSKEIVNRIKEKVNKNKSVKKTNYTKKELRFNNFTQRERSREEWDNLENRLLGLE